MGQLFVHKLVTVIGTDPNTVRAIKYHLCEGGLKTVTSATVADGLELIEEKRPDLVILALPYREALDAMMLIHEDHEGLPVFIMLSDGSSDQTFIALETGAAQCRTEKLSPGVFLSLVRAILRRTGLDSHVTVRSGNLEIDPNGNVKAHGRIVDLTDTERKLLRFLVANRDKAMMTQEILCKVWGPEFLGDLQYLRVWISRLRFKLGLEPRSEILKTFPCMGYGFFIVPPVIPVSQPSLTATVEACPFVVPTASR